MKWLSRKSAQSATETSMQRAGSEVDDNFAGPLRKGLVVLIVGFGGFMLWASLAPLGSGESATGVVEAMNNSKVVQNFTGGTVKAIPVHNGEKVKAGEVLARLNPTKARSKRSRVRAQYIAASVTQARLLAESADRDHIEFDDKLKQRFGDDTRYPGAVKTQKQLFKTRRESHQGKLDILHQKIKSTRTQLADLKRSRASRQAQIDSLQKQIKSMRELAESGYVPRNKILKLERQAASLQGKLSNTTADIGRMRSQIPETKLKIQQTKQTFQKKVQSRLSDLQEKTATLSAQLESLDYAVNQTTIRAPIDGFVQNMQIHTIGGTIKSGKKIMEVVPADAGYVIQAKLPVQAIDQVDEGLPVKITFPALTHANIPAIAGRLKTVSASRITDQKSKAPYYSIEVAVTDKGKHLLAKSNSQLRAGMPASVMIQLGERTMLDYLTEPFLERLTTAFSEKD